MGQHNCSFPLSFRFWICCYCSVVSNSLWPHGLQYPASLSFSILWNLFKLMSHPTILSSVTPFSSYPQSFPSSESFPMSWLFASCGQSIGALASASVLPVNIQGWFLLGLTGLISLLSKRRSGIFSRTTIRKHQFFDAQPSLWSNSNICTWLLEKP